MKKKVTRKRIAKSIPEIAKEAQEVVHSAQEILKPCACGGKGYVDLDKIGQYREFCDCEIGRRLKGEIERTG